MPHIPWNHPVFVADYPLFEFSTNILSYRPPSGNGFANEILAAEQEALSAAGLTKN